MDNREIICIHIGQAGIQIGSAIWELFTIEHELDENGHKICYCPWPLQDNTNSIFIEFESGKFVPRCLIVDSESMVVDEIRTGIWKTLFDDKGIINGKEDAATIFGRGYSLCANDVLDRSLSYIRGLLEGANFLNGFLIFHSLGGGTGSGLTCRITEVIQTEAPRKPMIHVPIVPPTSKYGFIVEPYNGVLSTAALLESSSLMCMMENEALYKIAEGITQNTESLGYHNINRHIAQITSSLTTSYRFSNKLSSDFSVFQTNLVPFPGIHFPIVSYMPSDTISDANLFQITKDCFSESKMTVKLDPYLGSYMSCCLLYRGMHCRPLTINGAIRAVKSDPKIKFVDWCPTGFKVAINIQMPGSFPLTNIPETKRSLCLLSNSTAIIQVWTKLLTKFQNLISRKAYLHWFAAEGTEEDIFRLSEEKLMELIFKYRELEVNKNANALMNDKFLMTVPRQSMVIHETLRSNLVASKRSSNTGRQSLIGSIETTAKLSSKVNNLNKENVSVKSSEKTYLLTDGSYAANSMQGSPIINLSISTGNLSPKHTSANSTPVIESRHATETNTLGINDKHAVLSLQKSHKHSLSANNKVMETLKINLNSKDGIIGEAPVSITVFSSNLLNIEVLDKSMTKHTLQAKHVSPRQSLNKETRNISGVPEVLSEHPSNIFDLNSGNNRYSTSNCSPQLHNSTANETHDYSTKSRARLSTNIGTINQPVIFQKESTGKYNSGQTLNETGSKLLVQSIPTNATIQSNFVPPKQSLNMGRLSIIGAHAVAQKQSSNVYNLSTDTSYATESKNMSSINNIDTIIAPFIMSKQSTEMCDKITEENSIQSPTFTNSIKDYTSVAKSKETSNIYSLSTIDSPTNNSVRKSNTYSLHTDNQIVTPDNRVSDLYNLTTMKEISIVYNLSPDDTISKSDKETPDLLNVATNKSTDYLSVPKGKPKIRDFSTNITSASVSKPNSVAYNLSRENTSDATTSIGQGVHQSIVSSGTTEIINLLTFDSAGSTSAPSFESISNASSKSAMADKVDVNMTMSHHNKSNMTKRNESFSDEIIHYLNTGENGLENHFLKYPLSDLSNKFGMISSPWRSYQSMPPHQQGVSRSQSLFNKFSSDAFKPPSSYNSFGERASHLYPNYVFSTALQRNALHLKRNSQVPILKTYSKVREMGINVSQINSSRDFVEITESFNNNFPRANILNDFMDDVVFISILHGLLNEYSSRFENVICVEEEMFRLTTYNDVCSITTSTDVHLSVCVIHRPIIRLSLVLQALSHEMCLYTL